MMRLLEHMHSKRLLNCFYKTFTMLDGNERKVRDDFRYILYGVLLCEA